MKNLPAFDKAIIALGTTCVIVMFIGLFTSTEWMMYLGIGVPIALGIPGLALCFIMLNRNQRVYAFRCDLLRRIGDANRADRYEDWQSRFELFRSVSYDDMMKWHQPFRSLDSYYDMKKFRFPEITDSK